MSLLCVSAVDFILPHLPTWSLTTERSCALFNNLCPGCVEEACSICTTSQQSAFFVRRNPLCKLPLEPLKDKALTFAFCLRFAALEYQREVEAELNDLGVDLVRIHQPQSVKKYFWRRRTLRFCRSAQALINDGDARILKPLPLLVDILKEINPSVCSTLRACAIPCLTSLRSLFTVSNTFEPLPTIQLEDAVDFLSCA